MKKTVFAVFGALLVSHAAYAFDRGEKIICGTNEQDEIWCTTHRGMEHGRWERVRGSLRQVIVRDGALWGVNRAGEIYFAADINNPQWTRLQGKAKEISEGHGLVCIVNDRDEIWCAEKGITSPNPEWHKAPDGARLKFVSVN